MKKAMVWLVQLIALVAVMLGTPAYATGKNGNVEGNCGVGSGHGNAKCKGGQSEHGSGGSTGGQGGSGGQGGAGGSGGSGGAGGSASSTSNASSRADARAASRSISAAQAAGGTATATGGSATGGNATAAGGTGGSSSATGGSGVGQVSVSGSTTNVRPPAYAPSVFPTANCAKGASIGIGGVLSAAGTEIDVNCARIEKVKTTAETLGDYTTAMEIMCGDDEYRAARRRTGQPCHKDRENQQDSGSDKCKWLTDQRVREREGCKD